MSDAARSASRGRERYQSSGRGGLGNIRPSSVSRDTRTESGPDDFSVTRGREPISHPTQIFSTGRGGAGNLRSPSRDGQKTRDVEEDVIIREYRMSQEGAPVSTGRGGIGNISRSRSREPAASNPTFHSTGRGGVGNLVEDEESLPESIDEDLKKYHDMHAAGGYHSTGRGGNANITSTVEPVIEHHLHVNSEYQSTGRGGAGNIVKE